MRAASTRSLHGALRLLCVRCHNKVWADDKRGYSTAIDVAGNPIDPRHPANAKRRYGATTEPEGPEKDEGPTLRLG
jgi:hypothetical protein